MKIKSEQVTIRAPINIALIKYWGKLHEGYNIPLNSSFSLTLDKTTMYSETSLIIDNKDSDTFFLYDKEGTLIEDTLPRNFDKLKSFFSAYVLEKYARKGFGVSVKSMNTFPTKAGLASSASGLSCIALCFCRLFNYFEESEEELDRDVFENIREWFLTEKFAKIEKIFTIVLLLRIISGSSCRSTYLFSVLQIGPDLLTDDLYDLKEDKSNSRTLQQEINKEILRLSNWKYSSCLENSSRELNNYFNATPTSKNNPDLIFHRFNYQFSKPHDWRSISNACIAFPLTNLINLPRQHLVDFFANIQMYVCLLHKEKKKIGSTDGMIRSVLTSEGLIRRVDIVRNNILTLLKSIRDNNIAEFLTVVMKDSNSFHSVCLDTYPSLFYLSDRSRDVIHFIHEFNDSVNAVVVGYTFDAGPNPFILVSVEYKDMFISKFRELFSVKDEDLMTTNILI